MGESVDLHIGGYHLTEAIGTGGMGSVFRAAFKGNHVTKSILAALTVTVLCGAAFASDPQRHAVVIGINDYADPAIPDLKYAESDARAMYDTLTDSAIGKFPKDNVALLLGKDATPSAITGALYKLRGVDKNDLVVVFYSGHGAKEGDEAFWVTQNADAKALPATALPNSAIRKWLGLIPSEKLVVLLDCCYAASTVKKSLGDPGKLFGDFTGKGRVTIAGAAENQEALEMPDAKAGVFTHFLVSGLRGRADTNADGAVTFEELWGYLGQNVRKASVKQGGLHEPVIMTDGATPQFLLTFNPAAAAASIEFVKALRKLFDENAISGTQYDEGRKALTEPATDAVAAARREVYSDLAAGRLSPKYLTDVLARRLKEAQAVAPPLPLAGGKPTVAVVPFTVLGDLNVKDAGAILAERMLPLFAEKYQLVDQMQLSAFLQQDDLKLADLVEMATKPAAKGMSKAVKLRAVRLLVVGTVSSAPDGLTITARLCDWQTGRIEDARIGQVAGEDWKDLVARLPSLAGKLTGASVAEPPAKDKKEITLDLGNNISMKLILIPAGKFTMGSPDGEKDHQADESPQREVTISKPFYMGVYEVTQEQYEQVIGKNPSSFKGAQNPVETVSWDEAVDFCKKLSQKTGKTVSLPTEAQWEYACRAGSKTRFSFGDADGDLCKYGNYCDQSNTSGYSWQDKDHNDGHDKTAPVGSFKPNAFGLYDMHGNVWEWCSDWYADSYANAKNQDPQGPDSGTLRVLRGGGWGYVPLYCRSAFRIRCNPVYRYHYVGFRVVVLSGMD